MPFPRMLEEAGLLKAFYTDSCEYSLLGVFSKIIGKYLGGNLKRLANRKIIGVPRSKIFCSDYSTIKRALSREIGIHSWIIAHAALSQKMVKWYDGCNIFYNMYHENLQFLEFLQGKNVHIISDVFISPNNRKLLFEEYNKLNLVHYYDKKASIFQEQLFFKTAKLSHSLLCPSEFVADGIIAIAPEFKNKIKICPYGSSIDFKGEINKPIKGRFFWAGGDWVRKGLYYLAEAANELEKKYPEMEIRIAGITDPEVISMDLFKKLNFLGKLDKKRMQEEFLSADAFIFPTLSEGMAGVVLEAITAGCPVITTKAAGIDSITSGVNGLIIQPKDSVGLANSIENIYLDRNLRDSISLETIKIAGKYSMVEWKKRLVNLLLNLK